MAAHLGGTSYARGTPPTTSATPRRRLLPTPTPRRRADLPSAALSPTGALRRDLDGAAALARRLVAALSGGDVPPDDAALPDLLREAAQRAAELRRAATNERTLRLAAETGRAAAERRAMDADARATEADAEKLAALAAGQAARAAAQQARAARDATQATYHGLTKRTATLDAELASLRAERRATKRGLAVLRRSRSRDREHTTTAEERNKAASLQLARARDAQDADHKRAAHYAEELSNVQRGHRRFAADCAVALRASEFDRGLWRLKSGLSRHHLALRSVAFQRLMVARRRPASPSKRPPWPSARRTDSVEARRDAARRQGTAIAGYY